MRRISFWIVVFVLCWVAADLAHGADLRVPQDATAGQSLTIGTGGGDTLYLVGPGQVIKRKISGGGDVQIPGDELHNAGRWIAIVRGGANESQVFWVRPGKAENLNFLARPSRVPVNRPGVISGVAFVFDKYENLVLDPTQVKFSLSVGAAHAEHAATSSNGVAWVTSSSAPKAGAAQFVASLPDAQVRRVIEQVASEPCYSKLRMKVVQRDKGKVVVETDPVVDCTGNAVPDGTIVTFTQTDPTGRSVVDARIKKGVARAQLPAEPNARISVASGVVLGNEIRLGGGE
ncbi:MAG TPA: hypothetical protein VE783_04240 [Candidatus Limnocylindrales bacterium]|jgi:hypothetical protein|nr:hypothetical protein [Candidatus Limnocylindrales bacterium]